MKLMIIDDHAGVRKLIGQMIATPGDILRECASGDEAVRLAPEFRPDCVTLDIQMPGLCALETARAIRALHPEVRIIIVSGYDRTDLHRIAAEAGTDGYVAKENLGELHCLFASARLGLQPELI